MSLLSPNDECQRLGAEGNVKIVVNSLGEFHILLLDNRCTLRYHNIVHKLPFSGFVKRGLGPAQ